MPKSARHSSCSASRNRPVRASCVNTARGLAVMWVTLARSTFRFHGSKFARRNVCRNRGDMSGRSFDLGVRAGRVAEIGRLANATAHDVLDADGMIVAPGIVDAHTHYDPQLTFDPTAAMSSYHGVTTVLAGNCGFSIAPTRADARDFVQALFAKVEQMHPDAMGAIAWDFESFPEYLRAREGRLGINMACYVGHSNVRRWVMGPEGSTR